MRVRANRQHGQSRPGSLSFFAMSGLLTEEQAFSCPCCGAAVSMLLELAHGAQEYVEDCEVCCSPILVSYEVEDGIVTGFVAVPSAG